MKKSPDAGEKLEKAPEFSKWTVFRKWYEKNFKQEDISCYAAVSYLIKKGKVPENWTYKASIFDIVIRVDDYVKENITDDEIKSWESLREWLILHRGKLAELNNAALKREGSEEQNLSYSTIASVLREMDIISHSWSRRASNIDLFQRVQDFAENSLPEELRKDWNTFKKWLIGNRQNITDVKNEALGQEGEKLSYSTIVSALADGGIVPEWGRKASSLDLAERLESYLKRNMPEDGFENWGKFREWLIRHHSAIVNFNNVMLRNEEKTDLSFNTIAHALYQADLIDGKWVRSTSALDYIRKNRVLFDKQLKDNFTDSELSLFVDADALYRAAKERFDRSIFLPTEEQRELDRINLLREEAAKRSDKTYEEIAIDLGFSESRGKKLRPYVKEGKEFSADPIAQDTFNKYLKEFCNLWIYEHSREPGKSPMRLFSGTSAFFLASSLLSFIFPESSSFFPEFFDSLYAALLNFSIAETEPLVSQLDASRGIEAANISAGLFAAGRLKETAPEKGSNELTSQETKLKKLYKYSKGEFPIGWDNIIPSQENPLELSTGEDNKLMLLAGLSRLSERENSEIKKILSELLIIYGIIEKYDKEKYGSNNIEKEHQELQRSGFKTTDVISLLLFMDIVFTEYMNLGKEELEEKLLSNMRRMGVYSEQIKEICKKTALINERFKGEARNIVPVKALAAMAVEDSHGIEEQAAGLRHLVDAIIGVGTAPIELGLNPILSIGERKWYSLTAVDFLREGKTAGGFSTWIKGIIQMFDSKEKSLTPGLEKYRYIKYAL